MPSRTRGLFDDWAPPSRIPEKSFLYLGANPAHSPERESQRRQSCSVCGGVRVMPNGREEAVLGEDDPIEAYETMTEVCGGCGRSVYDGLDALDKATRPGDGTLREGYEDRAEATSYEGRARAETREKTDAEVKREAIRGLKQIGRA